MDNYIAVYKERLNYALDQEVMGRVPELGQALRQAWRNGKTVYICGNGGSAGNAVHLANDLIYGAGMRAGLGLRVESLSANPAVLTCLGNDLGYDEIYAQQLRVKGQRGDVLIVLSGSGNSPNVVKALEVGNDLGLTTFAILGFSGGKCKDLAQVPLHFPINDMQIAEDLQLIVGHICMQWLCEVLGHDAETYKVTPERLSA
ncbi:MAG: SIS domain-containing protein [Leptolyngbyaceae cyanobacterium]